MKRSTLARVLEHSSEFHRMRIKEKQNRLSNNLKALNERAKQLNKHIPDDVLAIVYVNQPIGSSFFKKYEEWF